MTFVLDGIMIPAPAADGYTITPNHIWSANAGRNSSTGQFAGDIIAVKHTVTLTYAALSQAEMQLFWDIQSGLTPWHTLRYPQFDGSLRVMTCYIADVSYTMRRFDLRTQKPCFAGVTIELIEC